MFVVDDDDPLCSITFRLVASLADFGGVAVAGAGAETVVLDFDTNARPVLVVPYLLVLPDFLILELGSLGVTVPLRAVEGGLVTSDGEIFLATPESTFGLVATFDFDFDRDLVVFDLIPESVRLFDEAVVVEEDFLISSITLLSLTSLVVEEVVI